ncbi:unnamed protein product [Protopolystoma xenopodis]|uniref:Uncharacterized protein n=1 Tax=Protopolystoma xenopodis TaxID=117903 RepID=A0A448WLH1_9PLAT|nr:unnamed protein product [Protopolystoma xenopodis]
MRCTHPLSSTLDFFPPPFSLVPGMWIRICNNVTQSSFPKSYQSLSLGPYDPLAIALVQIFHSILATPSALTEALFHALCVCETNLRLKSPSNSDNQAISSWTTSIVKQAYCQPTSSSLHRVYPVSIPKYQVYRFRSPSLLCANP